jgi:meso-butanediol dehydrogenase/(S,S)-butanediol dehydrogenase/diacetyl reductase
MRFEGRVAIVTGAGSGIGRATAQRLAAEGARLVLVDWSEEGLAETRRLLGDSCDALVRQMDVSDEAAVEALVADALARFQQIDVLCNNAGISGGSYPPVYAPEQQVADWQRIIAVNLVGPMLFTKYASRAMIERRSGAIVNTASVAGIRSGAGGNAYSASKAGVINLTQTTACDLGEFGIRVNAVCPGLVETGMTARIFEFARSKGKEDRLGARAELRRYGRPEEVAAAIAFLASDDASFITGQALPVDGGNTASLNLPGMKV